MADPAKRLPSFDKAVWSYVIKDFKAGLRARLRIAIEGVVSLALGYLFVAEYGSADAALDFTIEKVLVILAVPFVMMLIHGLWSLASAPRSIYYKQQAEIDRLSSGVETLPVSIVAKMEWRNGKKSCWVILEIENTKDHALEHVVATYTKVEPLRDKRRLRPSVEQFVGLPLLVLEDRACLRDKLPRQTFSIYGRRQAQLILARWGGNPESLVLQHASYHNYQQNTGNPHAPHVTMTAPLVPDRIPHGRYRIEIDIRIPSGASAQRVFILSTSSQSLRFKEEA